MCRLVHADIYTSYIYIYIYIYYVLVCSATISHLFLFPNLFFLVSVNIFASDIAQLTLNSVAKCPRDAILAMMNVAQARCRAK